MHIWTSPVVPLSRRCTMPGRSSRSTLREAAPGPAASPASRSSSWLLSPAHSCPGWKLTEWGPAAAFRALEEPSLVCQSICLLLAHLHLLSRSGGAGRETAHLLCPSAVASTSTPLAPDYRQTAQHLVHEVQCAPAIPASGSAQHVRSMAAGGGAAGRAPASLKPQFLNSKT